LLVKELLVRPRLVTTGTPQPSSPGGPTHRYRHGPRPVNGYTKRRNL